MGFNEKSHAFLAARYYQRLTETFGERGERTFIHATQVLCRAAGPPHGARAIRDGKELTYETYQQYGEWVNTEEIIREGCSNQKEVESGRQTMCFV
jgi:hypothetical protein